MFIEVKGRPKEVVIQKLTKRNEWIDIGSYRDNEGFDYYKARALLEFKQGISEVHYRLLIRGKKSKRELQVLSSRAFDFYDVLASMAHNKQIYLSYMSPTKGNIMFANNENPHALHASDLHNMIMAGNGIQKAYFRPPSEADGLLDTYDITFVDGTTGTFSVLHT